MQVFFFNKTLLRVIRSMDYQILVNIAVGIITLMGGWVFKMILGALNEIKIEVRCFKKIMFVNILF